MIDFAALHAKADAAGRAAPASKAQASIKLVAGANYTTWARHRGIALDHHLGYAQAYTNVLRQAGELARCVRS